MPLNSEPFQAGRSLVEEKRTTGFSVCNDVSDILDTEQKLAFIRDMMHVNTVQQMSVVLSK